MITILIFAAFALWLAIKKMEANVMQTIVLILLFSFVGFMAAAFIPFKGEIKTTCFEIESLRDNSNISGSFVIGTGHVKSSPVYVFYQKTGENSFKQKTIPVESAVIKYTTLKPSVCFIEKDFDLSIPINWFSVHSKVNDPHRYEINVPKGAIINNYILDSE